MCFVPGRFWLAGHTRSVAYVYAPWLGVDVSDDFYPVHFGFVACVLTLKSFLCLVIGSGTCRPGYSEEPLRVELTLFVRSTVLPQL